MNNTIFLVLSLWGDNIVYIKKAAVIAVAQSTCINYDEHNNYPCTKVTLNSGSVFEVKNTVDQVIVKLK